MIPASEAKRLELPLIAFVVALLCLHLSVDFATRSMALDGVIYAGIANLASSGLGSFWFPPHFESGVAAFHDHPPLGLWILNRWFALFGEAFWVERAFNALVTLLVAGLIVHLWSRTKSPSAWWPLLLFFLMPVTTYALKNNSLEGLLTLTTLVGVGFAWAGKDKPIVNVLVGLACLTAVTIKGPVGLFPLVAPACFSLLVDGDWRRAIGNSLIAGVTLVAGLALLLAFEPARISWLNYLDGQLLASLRGLRTIEHGRGYLVGQLLLNAAIGSALVVSLGLVQRKFQVTRVSWAYLAIGLTASLPLLISPRHYKHYLLPSLPYFALCLGLIVSPQLKRLRKEYVWAAAGVVLAVAVLRFIWHFGMPGEDVNEINDAQRIAQVVQPQPLYFCAANLQRRAYLLRNHRLRSSRSDANDAEGYYVCDSSFESELFVAVLPLSEELTLWRRRRITDN